jgi:hypothetical protein
VMRADSAETIGQRLDEDPWTHLELLRIRSITPWILRLGDKSALIRVNG